MKILIIGITGGIGNAFALACSSAGWKIRALHRHPEQVRTAYPEVEWVKGDAMVEQDVIAASEGVDVVFHGANPPGYKNWRQLALPMLKNSIAAAVEQNARLVFPGNVYNFGPDAWPVVSENSPQNPETRKGKIRVEMELLLKASTRKGARVLIVRAGDFFGPDAKGSWLAQGMVKPGKKVASVVYPGRHDAGHNWAYLPDLAETMVQLLQSEERLADFEVFNFGGHYFPKGVTIAREILKAAGAPGGAIKPLPWFFLKLASPFVSTLKELMEMRYLWQQDLQLDNAKLAAFLKSEPHTPTNKALKTTLKSLKCI